MSKILILLLIIIFLLTSIRIFFIFLVSIKKNFILNKSVYKNVFKGKLSLIIILIFYGISFGLVGGTSLITKNSQRSILKQYNENNLYQYETIDRNFKFYDDISNLEITYWNKLQIDKNKKIPNSKSDYLVNSIIPKILVDSDKKLSEEDENWVEYFTPDKIENYNKILDNSGNQVDLKELFGDEVFNYKNNNLEDYMGWSYYDLDDAINGYLSYYIEKKWDDNNFILKKYENINSFVDYVKYKLFDSKYKNILDFVISSNFLNKLDVSYKATGYFNISSKLSLTDNMDFEIVVLNDIDWTTGDSLEATNNSKDIFQSTKTNDNLSINNIEYIDGENIGDKESGFRKQSNLFNETPESNLQNYNVNVQEDYLKANNLRVGDKIEFSPTTSFTIVNEVRFSEVTYPIMGINVLPNEKKQSFIQMNLSDFLIFCKSNSYDSIYNRKISYFFGENELYKDLTSIDKWLSIRPPNYDERISIINRENDYYKQYDLNEDKVQNLSSRYIGKGINTQEWLDSTKLIVNQDSDGNYQGASFSANNIKSISSLSTIQSLRALMGSVESQATEKFLNLFSGIFMTIVLIVISMLISKRINSLGKQLGTLKAMGMNNKNISSSYVIFPLIIIGLGFIVSSLVSPIIMIIFKGIMSKYYYISFTSFPLSFKYFSLLLFIPLILSISISYFISLRTLNKSTLDLLSNKGKDSPNILVRSFGYITHKKMSFSFSYVSKGLLRGVGKSSLLFLSIFFSTMLTSFAMSSTTMIKHQTENSLKYLNFDSMEISKNENLGEFNVEKMYKNNGELVYEDRLIKNEELRDVNFSYLQNNKEFFVNNNFETTYKTIRDIIMNPIENSIDKNIFSIEDQKVNNNKDNYLIDRDVMSSIFFSESILKFLYNKTSSSESMSFYQWEENEFNSNGNSLVTFSKMSWITNNWLTSLASNFIKNNEKLEIPDFSNLNTSNLEYFLNDLENFVKNVHKNSSDISFGTIYYNQFSQTITDILRAYPMQYAINDESYFEFAKLENKNKIPDYSSIELNVTPDEETFRNFLGSDSKISNDLWSLFDPYIDNNGDILKTNFIPVIATTQSIVSLDDMVKKGLATKHNNNVYTVSAPFKTYKSNQNKSKWVGKTYLKVDIKIAGTLFMGGDFGAFTTQEFIQKYLENYNYNEIENQFIFDKNTNTFKVYDNNYDYKYDILGENYVDAFNVKPSYLYNVKNSKNPLPSNLVKRNSPLAISANKNLFNYLITNNTSTLNFTLKELLLNINEDIIEIGKLSNNLYSNNAYPLKVDRILDQASKAYEMIITFFIVISFFAIFMSTTIILISIKDIIDSSRREISMLKAFGYSNTKATSLLMLPYLFIILLAFILAFPLTFAGLSIIAKTLTIMTGNFFIFTLTITQILILISFILGFSLFLMLMAYFSFRRANALEAIKETDE